MDEKNWGMYGVDLSALSASIDKKHGGALRANAESAAKGLFGRFEAAGEAKLPSPDHWSTSGHMLKAGSEGYWTMVADFASERVAKFHNDIVDRLTKERDTARKALDIVSMERNSALNAYQNANADLQAARYAARNTGETVAEMRRARDSARVDNEKLRVLIRKLYSKLADIEDTLAKAREL